MNIVQIYSNTVNLRCTQKSDKMINAELLNICNWGLNENFSRSFSGYFSDSPSIVFGEQNMLLMSVVVSCLGQWSVSRILDRTVQTHTNTHGNDPVVWRQSVEIHFVGQCWSRWAYCVHSLRTCRRTQRQGVQQKLLLSVQESRR